MKKKVLSWLLCFTMVLSAMTGITFATPAQDVQAEETEGTGNETETETTTWKVLWVVPDVVTYSSEGNVVYQGSKTTDEVTALTKIIPNVEKAVYEYSNHKMTLDSDMVVLTTLEVGLDYTPEAASLVSQLASEKSSSKLTLKYGDGFTSVEDYDQVICYFQPTNKEDASKSLKPEKTRVSGGRISGSSKTGFSVISLAEDLGVTEAETNRVFANSSYVDENGKVRYYKGTEVAVGCILDSLSVYVSDYYPEDFARDMPITHNVAKYYKNTTAEDFDVMNTFYKDFFNGTVPVSTKSKLKWGMQEEDYKNKPTNFVGALGNVTITSLEDWNNLCFKVGMGLDDKSSTITLTKNIDAAGETIHRLEALDGDLKGNGYAIVNATLTDSLIGENSGKISDLLLDKVTLKNTKLDGAALLVDNNSGTISGCGVVTGTLTAKNDCAAIARENSGTISYCFNGASVTAAASTGVASGIVAESSGILKNCFNYGMITGGKKGTSYGIGVNTSETNIVAACYTLENYAKDALKKGTKDDSATVVDAETLASAETLTALNGDGTEFAKGNGYPTINGAKYTYMTTGGSTLALADADAEPTVTVWTGKSVKLVTGLTATKWVTSTGAKKSGSVTWIVKNEPTEITYDANHGLTVKSDTTLASVSKGTVKGKAAGKVYVYAVETGSQTAEVFVVDVRTAPSAVATYYEAVPNEETVKYTSDVVPDGGSVKLYFAGTVGSAKSGTWEALSDEQLTYELAVPKTYAENITYELKEDESGAEYFEVTVKDGTFEKFAKTSKGVKKAFTVSLSLKNVQSGKKTTFKLTVSNPVKTVTVAGVDGAKVTTDAETKMVTVTLDSAKDATQTVNIKETLTAYDTELARTDSTKIVRIPYVTGKGGSGYGFSTTGAITLNGKTSTEQNKVSITAVKGEENTYKVTAKKGTQPGTEAYFIIWHNSYTRTSGAGYTIVKVVVGEANHVKTMALTKATDDTNENFNKNVTVTEVKDTNHITVTMPSAKTPSTTQYAYIAEATTLEKDKTETEPVPDEGGGEDDGTGEDEKAEAGEETETPVTTDYSVIYKLPNGNDQDADNPGFSIAPNGVVTVSGALTSGQKMVSMTLVKGKTDQYVIKAAKGTPEGTEAYFLLYHNPEQYSIISVTVGTPNKVKSSVVAKHANNKVAVTLDKETFAGTSDFITTIEIPYSKAAQTVLLTETVSLMNGEAAATDVSSVARLAGHEAHYYTIAPNKASVKAVGTLSSAQKKISMSLKKDSSNAAVNNLTLKIAKGTPVGTEVYYMIYHNDVKTPDGSQYLGGSGIHVIKVIITEAKEADPTPTPTPTATPTPTPIPAA